VKVYTKSDDPRPSGWCTCCRRRVEPGEGVPALFVPGPAVTPAFRALYLLCRRCARRSEHDPRIFERVESRILAVAAPIGGRA